MRWMEALVERAGSAAPPSVQRVWEGERAPSEPLPRRPRTVTRHLTRVVNFVLALLALILLLPVLLVLAVVVRLTSRGPVLYLQERVGLDRRTLGRAVQNPAGAQRPRRPAVHDLQVPHDAGRRRARERAPSGPRRTTPG